VLSYRNIEYLHSCLDSIIFQTYDNIELIISNDGADEFDVDAVTAYAENKRNDNITKLVVNKNEQNVGTVRHLNIALGLSTGDYIMYIACDDVYNNENVVKDLVEGFQKVPSDVMSIVGQTGMYNEDLSECEYLFIDKKTQRLINELTPEELYLKHMSHRCVFPAASRIYKREIFEKYGLIDERYVLVEDVTSSAEYAKQGMRTYYLDIMCVNHRHGGVSHSNLKQHNKVQELYQRDLILYFNEFLKEKDKLSKSVLKAVYAKIILHHRYLNEILGVKNPLISIMVLSYTNVEYLYSCLESIFAQTYDNIELIISNDGADEFDVDTIRDYVDEKRSDNIKNVIINKNENNLGTVKHFNIAYGLSSGDYIMYIACDDIYSNDNVVKDIFEGFYVMPSDAMSIAGQTGMYNEDLTVFEGFFTNAETKKIINDLTPVELYKRHLSWKCVFPGSARIYKREAFEQYGLPDEKYFLIEDWTSSIMHAKQGMRTYYLDIMCVNHRHGGVSSGNLDPNSYAQKMFHLDMFNLFTDILKDKELFNKSVVREVKGRIFRHKKQYELVFMLPSKTLTQKLLTIGKYAALTIYYQLVFNTPFLIKSAIKRTAYALYRVDWFKLFILISALYILNYLYVFELIADNDTITTALRYMIYISLALLIVKKSFKFIKGMLQCVLRMLKS